VRVLIVAPSDRGVRDHKLFWGYDYIRQIESVPAANPYPTYPLSLPLLGAMTKHHIPDAHVVLIDENVDQVPAEADFDVAAISATTFVAPRVYELAGLLKSHGVREVVVGGVHATHFLEEVQKCAWVDRIILGRADGGRTWFKVLDDIREGRRNRVYGGAVCGPSSFFTDCPPAFGLLKLDGYMYRNLQISRGCPYACTFCVDRCTPEAVKPREVVFREVEALRAAEGDNHRSLFFVDNLLDRSEPLLHAIMDILSNLPRASGADNRWTGQASWDVAGKEDFLTVAATSGARALLIGFESLSIKALRRIGKARRLPPSVETNIQLKAFCRQVISRVQSYGIEVVPSFMMGIPGDDSSPDDLIDFVEDTGVCTPHITIWTPLPGTPDFDGLRKGDGLLYMNPNGVPLYDWSKFDFSTPVCRDNASEVEANYWRVLQSVYERKKALRRVHRFVSMVERLPAIKRSPGEAVSSALLAMNFNDMAYSPGVRNKKPP